MRTLAIVLAILCLLAGTVAAADPLGPGKLNVPLAVTDFSGTNRIDEIVTGGVPLPKGEVRDLARLRIVDAAGKPVPCQFSVIDRWWAEPDPSLRWVLVDLLGSVYATETSTYYLRDDGGERPPPRH